MKKYKIDLSKGNLMTIYIILMGLFFYSCENTIINSSDSINYGVVINEINYHSTNEFDPGDWIELHNPTNETIEIGLWEFKDENDNLFTLPEDIVLLPGDYLVLCRNLDTFFQEFPSISNIVGDFVFGLNNAGDFVRLFDSEGLLVDEVEYDDVDPWPTEPDGGGPTLELIHPSLDNALVENWDTSNDNGGTPGEINSVVDE